MARPRGSISPDKVDPKVLLARRKARIKREMCDLRLAAGRERIWINGADGKIKEKWL